MKLDVISGFLGAGKTTFLNKILPQFNEKVVIIENEYGDIAVDGSLLQDDLPVEEIMAGCICCSLVLDFQKAIKELSQRFHPDRIIIEPSGVSCLSDVIKACTKIKNEVEGGLEINHLVTIVDITALEEYLDGFGVFYENQIANANVIVFSHLADVDEKALEKAVGIIKEINPEAAVWREDWLKQDGEALADWLFGLAEAQRPPVDADMRRVIFNAHDVFGSWSTDSRNIKSEDQLNQALIALQSGEYGKILRAKGILQLADGKKLNFNFTPYHCEYHEINSDAENKVAVIGCKLNEEKLADLF